MAQLAAAPVPTITELRKELDDLTELQCEMLKKNSFSRFSQREWEIYNARRTRMTELAQMFFTPPPKR